MIADRAPLVLAHRGLRKEARENTVAAFEAARRAGCDGVEFDVRALGDGSLVLHHDRSIRYRGRRRQLATATRAEVRSWGAAGRAVEPFSRALTWAQDRPRAWLDVELKQAGYERAVLRHLREANRLERVVLTSFLPEVCAEAKRHARRVPVGLISLKKEPVIVRVAHDLGLDVIVLHETNASPLLVRLARDVGLEPWIWGVRTARAARHFHGQGAAAFITDNPYRLLKIHGAPASVPRRWGFPGLPRVRRLTQVVRARVATARK